MSLRGQNISSKSSSHCIYVFLGTSISIGFAVEIVIYFIVSDHASRSSSCNWTYCLRICTPCLDVSSSHQMLGLCALIEVDGPAEANHRQRERT